MVDARDGDRGGGPAADEPADWQQKQQQPPQPSVCSQPQRPFLRRCSSGLLDSLRRRSLDQVVSMQDDSIAPSSVSDYQAVFREMKRGHPTASLGALQQMTMARLSELKAERGKERLCQSERQSTALDRWVGKIRQNQLDLSERTSLSLPAGRRSWRSSSDLSSRRLSVESGADRSSRSNEVFLILPTGAATGVEGTTEANLAPRRRRKSVDCHPCFGSDDDLDVRSLASGVSGLSLLSDWSGLQECDGDASSAKADGREMSSTGAKPVCPVRVRAKSAQSSLGHTCSNTSHGSLCDEGSVTKKPDEDASYCASTRSRKSSFDASGLIVGFSVRCESKDEEDDDGDGLIVGFVDRSDRFDE